MLAIAVDDLTIAGGDDDLTVLGAAVVLEITDVFSRSGLTVGTTTSRVVFG